MVSWIFTDKLTFRGLFMAKLAEWGGINGKDKEIAFREKLHKLLEERRSIKKKLNYELQDLIVDQMAFVGRCIPKNISPEELLDIFFSQKTPEALWNLFVFGSPDFISDFLDAIDALGD